jgi:hypothetical protein
MANAYDFPFLLETHRNGTLNDLFFTLEVLERLPELGCVPISPTSWWIANYKFR